MVAFIFKMFINSIFSYLLITGIQVSNKLLVLDLQLTLNLALNT